MSGLRRWAAAAAIVLAGCATVSPGDLKPGSSVAEIRARLGEPVAIHVLPGGGQRLEYRGSGPFTYMLDVDASGSLVDSNQVLTEANFRTIVAGMTPDEVRRTLGQPMQVAPGGRAGGPLWSYNFRNIQCQWFQVQFGSDGRTTGPGSLTTMQACLAGD